MRGKNTKTTPGTGRRVWMKAMAGVSILPAMAQTQRAPQQTDLNYKIRLDTIRRGWAQDFKEVDASGYHKDCWVHARAGIIPGGSPEVVVLMQRLQMSGSDVFFAFNDLSTKDLGKTWSSLVEHQALGRRKQVDGLESAVTALVPAWHAQTRKLLATGSVIRYRGNKFAGTKAARETGYSVYNPSARAWAPWQTLEMPGGRKFFNAGADSCQRVDLPNGDILLPVYFIPDGGDPKAYPLFRENGWATADNAFVTVVRCAFDGHTLRYLAHGDVLRVEFQRGLDEPSLAVYKNRYYMTLRNDANGFVTSSGDGLHFGPLKPWTWDDGSDLGNYNTQQHWVTHSNGLFLVYTRRGANNDHVFRHRAPLFMAQVDPEKLCVIRRTERTLVPERGARLGNFGVVNVNPQETWVVVSEYMQPLGCERHGGDNSVYAARIQWERPNSLA